MASNSQYALPLSLPRKKAQAEVLVTLKASSNGQSSENSMTIGGCFEHYTYRVTTLGWLKKKETKKMNNSDFRLFQVCHFKIVTTH